MMWRRYLIAAALLFGVSAAATGGIGDFLEEAWDVVTKPAETVVVKTIEAVGNVLDETGELVGTTVEGTVNVIKGDANVGEVMGNLIEDTLDVPVAAVKGTANVAVDTVGVTLEELVDILPGGEVKVCYDPEAQQTTQCPPEEVLDAVLYIVIYFVDAWLTPYLQ